MYVESVPNRNSPPAVLLRESRREDGKIVKRTLANLSDWPAAKILGIQQPHVSALTRNRAGNFSVGRLIDFLTALGQDVEITVTPTRKEHGALSIVFA